MHFLASISNLVIARAGLVAVLLAACGSEEKANPDAGTPDAAVDAASPDAPTPCVPSAAAPTYTELYTKYFAVGTPGHCANGTCHANVNVAGWVCGPDKASCYDGMVKAGLINTMYPTASRIADPKRSPLRWVNPNGPMPFDNPVAFPEGRDAILAWVAACAENN